MADRHIETAWITTQRQSRLVGVLQALAADAVREEGDIEAIFRRNNASQRENHTAACRQLKDEHEELTDVVSQEYTNKLATARKLYETQLEKLDTDQERFVEQARRQKDAALKAAKTSWNRARRDAKLSHEASTKTCRNELEEYKLQCDKHREDLHNLRDHVAIVLHRRRCYRLAATLQANSNPTESDNAEQDLASAMNRAVERFQGLHQQTAARLMDEGFLFLYFLLGSGSAALLWWKIFSPIAWTGLAVCGLVGAVVTIAIGLGLYRVVRRQTDAVADQLCADIAVADGSLRTMRRDAKLNAGRQLQRLDQQREMELNHADSEWDRVSKELEDQYETRFQETICQYQTRRDEIEQQWEKTVDPLRQTYPSRLEQMKLDYDMNSEQLVAKQRELLSGLDQKRQDRWRELVQRWSSGIHDFQDAVRRMNAYCEEKLPAWQSVDWARWTHATESALALRIGEYALGSGHFNDLPQDARLAWEPSEYRLPAVLSFPDCPSLLLKACDDSRDAAIRTLQNTMLRYLTAMPPGKVRFTIIDPTSLGQNFSAFMHLADYDEKLVTNRIWTESSHINRRLMDLTQHMEDVIQKYLRNEFESIQQYNEHAGEVAEPFQILVVANFPANFSEEAARRLVSIAGSGARCGVYTLISCDIKMNLPRNFDLRDLESNALTIQWARNQPAVSDDILGKLPLQLDQPPPDETFTAAVRVVAEHAQEFSRVEVPFSFVAPDAAGYWSGDSRSGVDVALGRAGATKLQYLELGKGTSQHVLIAGKTGSGKSTLLHALIINTALIYGPDEVQYFLIDFKKGVEFKPYAALQLPHARVIAVESEREFGMSVLEKLDHELQSRGDIFRSAGVQDVKGYRDAHPDQRMPRILLIIDEFQEFFVKDDKIAQDASLLLDRLIRQGRAFGIHVLLGSQTLAGAYSLARSTLGQMAVRIALQCSEADSHLILSEENSAARLLSRPGEAIYNNANGLFEGNHPFQVVWLPDQERENYLRDIQQLAAQRHVVVQPPIVFEGNVAADPSSNRLLCDLVESSPPAEVDLSPRAWLGAAVAIKDPTHVDFRRHGGSNLLMVGQHDEMATGVLANCLISLAATVPATNRNGSNNGVGSTTRFLFLDGSRQSSGEQAFWESLTARLSVNVSLFSPRDVATALAQMAAELDRRIAAGDETAPPWFLFIYNLTRFRDLRRSDNDFGFSSLDDGKPESQAQQLARLLRDGPIFGLHGLIWSDGFATVQRWMDRQTIRDMETRVLFQMSATDASNLMDSPAASKLGMHRGIVYSEERGEHEKFRPYGVPSDAWLAWVQERLSSRCPTQAFSENRLGP